MQRCGEPSENFSWRSRSNSDLIVSFPDVATTQERPYIRRATQHMGSDSRHSDSRRVGCWTFIFKEIEVPKSAPVNISLNLQLKKIETPQNNEVLSAIEMKISATNPSTREIYLLPNAWVAYGGHIAASPASSG